ncbi:short chain enoyl-CoA hydratase [Nocardia caishijiensis]|uniref:Short chain enoyl-CoA hydratase n=2 Tax=Nocardia caishijiensis TaxID=184756 RepID=A0ABQ6YJ78_9NOCA|nr:crotonase/enoyl-CoA hydratase family protein [Nocardia caishijiensis]KAF0845491.1 short chain enoyl-CoA hydratase [Nocardia caishijiensis]
MNAVLVEMREHVLVAVINRPQAMNAIDGEVSAQLGAALEQADNDRAVRVVVLTGAGDRAFCAGADLRAIGRGESILAEGHEQWGLGGYVRHPISKPTIAAVNGLALGGGTELVLASDLAVAASTATFGLPEVARGLFAAAGGAFRLPEQLPRKIAMEMLLTGEPITAARALEFGLINRVVPAEQVLDTAVELATRIATNAPLAVQASKRVALGIRDGALPDDDAWDRSDREIAELARSEDVREGLMAFVEKRDPNWQAR